MTDADIGAALDRLRLDLGADLAEVLHAALDRYRDFAATTPPEDAKGFAAHQSAAKAALAHLDALIGLAEWAVKTAVPEETEGPDTDVADLIAQARRGLAGLHPSNDDKEGA